MAGSSVVHPVKQRDYSEYSPCISVMETGLLESSHRACGEGTGSTAEL